MRILVVEDEHRIANSIKKGLEQEKYAVDVAYTGMNAAIDVTKEIKNKLVAARQPGVDDVQVVDVTRLVRWKLDRLAQLVVVPVLQVAFDIVDEFSASSRGEGGFGQGGTEHECAEHETGDSGCGA